MKLQCPHCQKDVHVNAKAVMKEQTFTFEIHHEQPLLHADLVAESITAVRKSLEATAKALGGPMEIFISDLSKTDTKTVITFVVVNKPATAKAKGIER